VLSAQCSDLSGAPSLSPLKTENRNLKTHSAFTLIELLVVIAIIGILMSLLFPAVNAVFDTARKAQARNDAVQIATAVTAFETEYGRLPIFTTTVNSVLVQTLAGITTTDNPRGIPFLEVQAAKKGKSGTNGNGFVDPWTTNTAYSIAMDNEGGTNSYDNNIQVSTNGSASGTFGIRRKVAVWNVTTNTRRQVRSWE